MKATEQYFPVVLFIMLYKVVLTFESVDETLWSYHSNEPSLPALTPGASCFLKFHKMKFGIFVCRILPLAKFGSEMVKYRTM